MVTPARQVQQQTPQQTSQAAYSSDSPWRATQGPPLDLPLRRQTPSTGKPLKLPNLPRLGSHSQQSAQLPPLGQYNHQHSQPQQAPQQAPHVAHQAQKFMGQQPQQPTFAQIVQQAQQAQQAQHVQPNLSPAMSKTGSGSPRAPKLNGLPSSASPSFGNAGDSAAHILGSVNSQMMPKLNTSSGMSGLNTVLPGIANQNNTSPSRGPKQPTSNTSMLQNLSLGDFTPSSGAPNSAMRQQSDAEKYGLKSLLGVMNMQDKERQNVVLGTELGQTGLNLGLSGEKLSRTFASPWQETSTHTLVPDFQLPLCYSIPTVVPQQQKLQNFDEGALFYIFYTMPRDAMQEAAAVELTNRSWRYHKELKMWLTKDPLSEPIQTNNQEESGIYIFFDPTTWKKVKRDYILYYPDIA